MSIDIGAEREKTLLIDDYLNEGYFTKTQWMSYFNQVIFVKKCADKLNKVNIRVLEIGKGNGIVASILQTIGYNVITWDINPHLKPDKVVDICDVVEISEQYDIVLCAEVLEHIPFQMFEQLVERISLLTSEYFIITLPNAKRFLKINIDVPLFHNLFIIPAPRFLRHNLSSMHFWEINSQGDTQLERIKRILRNNATIIEDGIIRENPCHYYFICHK